MKHIIMTILVLLLAGCGSAPAMDVYEQLEAHARADQKAEEVSLERSSQDELSVNTYQAVLDAGTDEIKRSENEREELIALNEVRQQLMREETGLRKKAMEEVDFEEMRATIEELDEKPRMLGEATLRSLETRHKAFLTYEKRYGAAMDAEEELLRLLTAKPDFVKIDEATAELNRQLRQTNKAQQEFNAATKRYNEQKPAFYKAAGLNIK